MSEFLVSLVHYSGKFWYFYFNYVGSFELDLTSHLFYKFISVVSSILLYHMNGRRFI